jgi:hypothetical protein
MPQKDRSGTVPTPGGFSVYACALVAAALLGRGN